jgi:autotransporter-associated beta strand protein
MNQLPSTASFTKKFFAANRCSQSIRRALAAAALSTAALLSGGNAMAATDTWSGATDAYWANSNWTGGNNPPVTGDSLTFGATSGSTTLYDNLNTSTVANFNTITFTAAAPAYKFWGNTITLTGGITNSSSNAQTINDALVISTGGENFTGNNTLNGSLSGSGYISVGTGTLTINGGGSQGQISMNGGTLNVGAGGLTLSNGGGSALTGTGTVNSTNGGVITLTGGNAYVNGNLTINAVLAGTGGFNPQGGGTVTLTAANTESGTYILSNGTLDLKNSLAIQNMTLAFNGSNSVVFDSSVSSNTFILGGLASNSNGTGNFAIQNNAGTPAAVTIDVGNNNAGNTYSGVMSGAGTFNKWGSGQEILSGTNTYTGNTGVAMGQLELNFAATNPGSNPATPVTNILYNGLTQSNSGTLVMGGKSGAVGLINLGSVAPLTSLFVNGKASTTNVQSFKSTTLAYGYSGIQALNGSGGSATLNLGSITHQAGGVALFLTPSAGGAVTTTGAINTSSANDASGILGGYAVVNSSSSLGSGSTPNYASVDASGNIIAYSGYTATPTTIGDSGAGTPTNIQLTGTSIGTSATLTSAGTTQTAANGGAVNINTIYNTQGSGATITIGSVLRLGVNGGILNNGSGITINGGTLTAGGNTTGVAGEISILEPNSTQNVQINSVIANNNTSTGSANSTGGGAVTVTIAGAPNGQNTIVTLAGNNTYSGGTYIDDGRVNLTSATALGTGTLYIVPGGEAIFNAGGTFANNMVVSGNGSGEGFGALRGGNGSAVLTGTITLAGDTSFSGQNAGMNVNGQITGNGNLTWQNGNNTLTLGNNSTSAATMNNWSGNFTINAGKVQENASNQLANIGGNVIIANTTLELNGNSDTVNQLISSGTVGQGLVQNTTTATASTLSIGNSNGGSFTFAGAFRDGVGSSSGTGTLKLDKVGAGIFTIGDTNSSGVAANNYAGGTQIDGGTLKLVASAPSNILGSTSGTLTVNTGGTLDLNGNSLTVGALGGTGGTILSTVSTSAVTLTAGTSANSIYSGVLQNGNATALNLIKRQSGQHGRAFLR